MRFSPLLQELIQALRTLPGVGPKTAQRMALSLLTTNRTQGKQLSRIMMQALDAIKHCKTCRIFSEEAECDICLSTKRDASQLCIVENPIDVFAVEQTNRYHGKYFVLLGRLSPLDGITPEMIGMRELKTLLTQKPIAEIIIATNPTIEGEATAHYLAALAKEQGIKSSRIAYGVPIGSELEYIDANTLAYALADRK